MAPANPPAVAPINRLTTPDRVADAIRSAILRGQIPPSTPLREVALASRLGVSRHTAREAFRLLAKEGILEHLAFRGVVVRRLTATDVADIYRVRRMLEVQGIEASRAASSEAIDRLAEAATRFDRAVPGEDWRSAFEADLDLHVGLVDLLGSPRLTAFATGLLRELRLAHFLQKEVDTAGYRRSRTRHRAIVRHVSRGERTAAQEALLAHLAESEALLRRGLGETAGPSASLRRKRAS